MWLRAGFNLPPSISYPKWLDFWNVIFMFAPQYAAIWIWVNLNLTIFRWIAYWKKLISDFATHRLVTLQRLLLFTWVLVQEKMTTVSNAVQLSGLLRWQELRYIKVRNNNFYLFSSDTQAYFAFFQMIWDWCKI